MAKKKKRPGGGQKPHGHYCKVCGEHKANEKFSGKGHAAHICKKCAALPVAERNELMAVNKIEGMAFRHLNESEIKWLRSRLNDERPAVREAAQEAHSMKFPRFERNMIKKGLTAFSLELYIHDEIVDDWGDSIPVNARVLAEDTGLFRIVRLDNEAASREVQIDPKEARRFLKAVIHELDALFWDEDYRDSADEYDPYLDILPEYRPDFDDEDMEPDDESEAAPEETREPVWSLRLELNNGEDKEMLFYSQAPDATAELYWLLMEYIEPDEDDAPL
ncbi:hypothetical protein LJC27_07165 [Christensenellaceae bacterium OttesenSCG-928-M15]|nr:hypothetical protein [Christensenellaceae bacterium OttesenSCG-928-M15]